MFFFLVILFKWIYFLVDIKNALNKEFTRVLLGNVFFLLKRRSCQQIKVLRSRFNDVRGNLEYDVSQRLNCGIIKIYDRFWSDSIIFLCEFKFINNCFLYLNFVDMWVVWIKIWVASVIASRCLYFHFNKYGRTLMTSRSVKVRIWCEISLWKCW